MDMEDVDDTLDDLRVDSHAVVVVYFDVDDNRQDIVDVMDEVDNVNVMDNVDVVDNMMNDDENEIDYYMMYDYVNNNVMDDYCMNDNNDHLDDVVDVVNVDLVDHHYDMVLITVFVEVYHDQMVKVELHLIQLKYMVYLINILDLLSLVYVVVIYSNYHVNHH